MANADPMKTKTGKTRLGPLSLKQLTEMAKTCRKKERSKIDNRIKYLKKKGFNLEENTETELIG
jgi:hypothetical protein